MNGHQLFGPPLRSDDAVGQSLNRVVRDELHWQAFAHIRVPDT